MEKTLLDLDRIPTLDELRTFFRENDFSSAAYIDLDYDKLDGDAVEFLEHAKSLMDEHWEPLSREMGLKPASSYYGKDNPLIALRDNMENLAAGGVLKLLEEHPERAAEILSQFDLDNPDMDRKADDLLHSAVETLMQVTDYKTMAEVVQAEPANEDFNHRRSQNFRAQDFDRKWNHTRAKMEVASLDELQDAVSEDEGSAALQIPDPQVDVEAEASTSVMQKNFWSSISEEDRRLLQMRMQGLTQKEIAQRLGYQTHSAVAKRLQKLKTLFEQCA